MNYIPLTQVCDFQGGSQPPKEQWIDHAEDGYIRMLQIRDFTQPDKDNIEYVRLTKTVKTCNEDDILIGRYGASVGKILTGLSGAYNVAIIKTIPDASKLTKRFLYHYLNSPYFQSFILSVGSRAAQAGFNKEDLSDAQIPQLSLKEQEYVTARLDKIVDLIALRKQQLSKLDELVKSRFIEMFGDTILNPFGWEKDNFGTVCDVRDGTHDSPQYYETGYPLVTSKNVTGGKIDLTDCSLICEADFKKINERSKVDMGDIIMPMIGTVGKPVIVDIEPNFAIKNVSLIKFKAASRVLNIYIRALLQSDYFDDVVLSKVRGGTQKFISLGDIRKLEILVPPIVMQKQFAAFVEQTDKSKFEIQKSLEKLETLKKALMQKYFG